MAAVAGVAIWVFGGDDTPLVNTTLAPVVSSQLPREEVRDGKDGGTSLSDKHDAHASPRQDLPPTGSSAPDANPASSDETPASATDAPNAIRPANDTNETTSGKDQPPATDEETALAMKLEDQRRSWESDTPSHLAWVKFRVDSPTRLKTAVIRSVSPIAPLGHTPLGGTMNGERERLWAGRGGYLGFRSYPGNYTVTLELEGYRSVAIPYTATMGQVVDLGAVAFDTGVTIRGTISAPWVLAEGPSRIRVNIINESNASFVGSGDANADGSYEVAGLPIGNYAVIASKVSYVCAPARVTAREEVETLVCDLSCQTPGQFSGQVTGSVPGLPAAQFLTTLGVRGIQFWHVDDPHLRIRESRDEYQRALRATRLIGHVAVDREGKFQSTHLPPGRYILGIRNSHIQRDWEVTVTAGGMSRVDITLDSSGSVSGRIVHTDGSPVSNEPVVLWFDPNHEKVVSKYGPNATTDADGHFRFPEAMVGKWRIHLPNYTQVQVDEYWVVSWLTVESGREAVHNLTLPRPVKTTVSIILDIDGKPSKILGYEYDWLNVRGEVIRSQSRAGRALETPISIEGFSEGTLKITLLLSLGQASGTHIRQVVTLPISEDPTRNRHVISLTLGSLKGRLTDTTPRSINKECVVELYQSGTGTLAATSAVHPIGDYEFAQVPDGHYDIVVRAPWGELYRGTVRVAGETRLDVPMAGR